ncbi:bifunctional Ribosomal protein L28-L24/L28p-like [Babesia duncani]|uniref:Bifunctional Ribosomal protein L28-L24/L28p-like n=1 Tax=Babesia duncani TaxID=323732 RepID=A0AAD9UQL7_9APIC|nr:bifunctional Ribosomal protein L28-L24/L28p-like [Babesia duncani]
MPRYPSLFGKYLRNNRAAQISFKKKQLVHPIPVKAYGRVPSASSQQGLYHDEDFNYYTKVSFSLHKKRIKLKPNVFRKDFTSRLLNCTLKNVKCTTSALHAITDQGGFDKYILNTPPEHLRSKFGETLREVMYFYMENPGLHFYYTLHADIASLGLQPHVFATRQNRQDPIFAIYQHFTSTAKKQLAYEKRQARFSPFYLPPESGMLMHAMHTLGLMPSVEGTATSGTRLNLWWNKNANQFRARLGM